LEIERQTIEQQSIIRNDEIKQLHNELNAFKRTNEALEEKNREILEKLNVSEEAVQSL
jgi:hypothetical protein